MKAHIRKYWDRLRSSFWFLPSVMTGWAVVLAFASISLDEAVMNQWLRSPDWAYTGGAEGASMVLGTIAGSMMTIAGVVFSMTLVALSLASSQFGSRLLRNFMRDTANQVVLGTFVATFVYCLLVMRTIRRAEDTFFVPHLSVTIGVMFALVSLGVLIYFIHHVAISIQADEIVARVGSELIDEVERLFPQHIGQEATQPAAPLLDLGLAFSHESGTVSVAVDGYLQYIDGDALMALAEREDVLLRLERRPGQYVVCGSPLAMAWPGDKVTEKFVAEVNSAFVLGNQRTSAQDVEFAVHQLVEIAVRALSPGINDPFTAMACVDRLGSALCRLAQRDMPSPHRFDEQGQLRIVAPAPTFSGIVDAAFNQIRQYARSSAAVTIRLLETITVIAAATRRPQDQAALRRHAEMIVRGARDGLPEDEDRRAAEDRYQAANRALFKAFSEPPAHHP